MGRTKRRRPAKVVIRRIDTGEIVDVVRPGKITHPRRQKRPRRRPRGFAASLDRAARDAGYEDYAAYLLSPRWRSLRARVLDRDTRQCQDCGGRTALQVHHLRYRLGREQLEDLTTLCQSCHRRLHLTR